MFSCLFFFSSFSPVTCKPSQTSQQTADTTLRSAPDSKPEARERLITCSFAWPTHCTCIVREVAVASRSGSTSPSLILPGERYTSLHFN